MYSLFALLLILFILSRRRDSEDGAINSQSVAGVAKDTRAYRAVLFSLLFMLTAGGVWFVVDLAFFEFNDGTKISVVEHQDGSISAYTERGKFWKGFDEVTSYRKISTTSLDEEKAGFKTYSLFSDGTLALISFSVVYKLPEDLQKISVVYDVSRHDQDSLACSINVKLRDSLLYVPFPFYPESEKSSKQIIEFARQKCNEILNSWGIELIQLVVYRPQVVSNPLSSNTHGNPAS